MDSMKFNFPHFEPLRMRNWQASIPSAYGGALDAEERLLQVINYCNEIGLLTDQMSKNWNLLLSWIKTNGLDDYVKSTLSGWVADGTFNKIINQSVLCDINKSIDVLTANYNTQSTAISLLQTALQNFIHSDVFNKTYDNASQRGDFWDTDLSQRSLNVKWFGAVGDGKTDDSQSIQNTIDKAYENFKKISTSDIISDSLSVIIPSGIYLINTGLVVPPMVKLKAIGVVKIIYTGSNQVPAVWVKNKDDIVQYGNPVVYKQAYTKGYIIDGTQGSFIICRQGAYEGNPRDGIGLAVGNDSDLGTDFSICRYAMRGVMITGFGEAIRWYTINHFMGNYYDFHIEDNVIGLRIGIDNTINNSNENFNFFGSLFAMCKNGAIYNQVAWDLKFFGCSFDYNDIAFHSKCGVGIYHLIGCHVEGNPSILSQEDTGSLDYYLSITKSRIVLSPTKILFSGYAIVHLEDNNIIPTDAQSIENLYDDNVTFISKNNSVNPNSPNIYWNMSKTMSLNGCQVTKDPTNLGTTYGISNQTNINGLSADYFNGQSAILFQSTGTQCAFNCSLGKLSAIALGGKHNVHAVFKVGSNHSTNDFDITMALIGTDWSGNEKSLTLKANASMDANTISYLFSNPLGYIDLEDFFDASQEIHPYIFIKTHDGIDATDFKFYLLKTCVWVD